MEFDWLHQSFAHSYNYLEDNSPRNRTKTKKNKKISVSPSVWEVFNWKFFI